MRKFLTPAYIILLLLGFFFIRSTLNETEIPISERDKKEKTSNTFEVKPVKVYLMGYSARMKNVDSVIDFLEHLREYEGFYFEKTEYTYGMEIDHVNGRPAPPEYKWRIFDGKSDITHESGDIRLIDETTYEIKLIHTSMLQ